MLDIKITRTTEPKQKPAAGQKLGFGKIFTDHMFVMNYTEGKGWHDPRIQPFSCRNGLSLRSGNVRGSEGLQG